MPAFYISTITVYQVDVTATLHLILVAGKRYEVHLEREIQQAHQVSQKDEGAFENTYQERVFIAVIVADFISQTPDGSGNLRLPK